LQASSASYQKAFDWTGKIDKVAEPRLERFPTEMILEQFRTAIHEVYAISVPLLDAFAPAGFLFRDLNRAYELVATISQAMELRHDPTTF
jgi:hypothetical protein